MLMAFTFLQNDALIQTFNLPYLFAIGIVTSDTFCSIYFHSEYTFSLLSVFWSFMKKKFSIYSMEQVSNIFTTSQKKVRNEVYFLHADKHQSLWNLGLLFLMKVARYVQSTKNRKLVIFLQSIKKSVTAAFVFYCDAKHSDISWGSSHVYCYWFPSTARLYKFSAWTLQYNS